MANENKSKNPLHDPVPEEENLLDHEYDGIREADNPLPRWWVTMFYVAIVFAIIYVPAVHMFDILPERQLRDSIQNAAMVAEQREIELEASGALDKDPVAAGQKYFKTFCVSCHGTHAEGGIGPNLTDNYWLHTPQVDSIRSVILNGVTAKGMPTWGPILGERKIKHIATYIETLWQTPPPVAGKKPEGEPYDMEAVRKPADAVVASAALEPATKAEPAQKKQ